METLSGKLQAEASTRGWVGAEWTRKFKPLDMLVRRGVGRRSLQGQVRD